MLPQPVPVTGDAPGAPLSRSDQVRLAARARNTQRAYLGHWTRFRNWAQEQGLDLPGGLEAALCDYLVRLAEDGKRMATIRQARAAIIKGAELAGWPKPGGSGVAEMMRGLGRILRGPQRQAAPLHAEASVMRDGLLRVSEAAALRWGTWNWPETAVAASGFRSRRPTRRPRWWCYTWDRPPSKPCWPSAPKRR